MVIHDWIRIDKKLIKILPPSLGFTLCVPGIGTLPHSPGVF